MTKTKTTQRKKRTMKKAIKDALRELWFLQKHAPKKRQQRLRSIRWGIWQAGKAI